MIEQSKQSVFPNELSLGLTKREYFAAMAMQGILANPSIEYYPEDLCKESLKHVDELIKQLNEK